MQSSQPNTGVKDKSQIIPHAYNTDEDNITIYYLNVEVIQAKNLRSADFMGKSDPYCEIVVNENMRRTKTIEQSLNPEWNAKFAFFVGEKPKEIRFHLFDFDDDMINSKDDILGETWFNFTDEFETNQVNIHIYYYNRLKFL